MIRKARRSVARLVVAASALAVPLVGLASQPASASVRYAAVGDGVALRSGPGTQYSVLQRVNNGTPLDIVCQIQGGTNIGGNATWDKLTGGQWVADYFTTSPSFNSYAPGLGDCYPTQVRTRVSPNGSYTLVMQSDGNLVLYVRGGGALWSSRTANHPGATAWMQGDGNLVVYSPSGAALWSSGTSGHSGSGLSVQNDGNVVIYSPTGVALWATGTAR